MKITPPHFHSFPKLLSNTLVLAACCLLCPTLKVHSAEVSWLGSNGTWSDGTSGGFNGTFSNGDSVTFGTLAANNTVTISGTVDQSGFSISNASNFYTFSGGNISGTGSLTKSGNGTAIISDTTTLSYSGNTVISSGTLQFNRTTAGSTPIGTGTVSLQGGTLRLAGNASNTFTISNNFTVGSAGGVIDWSRLSLSSPNPAWILNGSLALGGNLTVTAATGGSAVANQLFNGGIFVNTDATITNSNSATTTANFGNITGSADQTLTLLANTSTNWNLTSNTNIP
jgi:autotransporter-associated beta strand protein